NISLDRKPLSNGTPAMAALAMTASAAVIGITCRKPPNLRRSRVPVSLSTAPAAMNSEALKVAWLTVWKIAATAPSVLPNPSNIAIKPRWLMVEEARTPFRSGWNTAAQPPSSSEINPGPPSSQTRARVPANTGQKRSSTKTPSFTSVAECRYDETGVGADIADGSQKWN